MSFDIYMSVCTVELLRNIRIHLCTLNQESLITSIKVVTEAIQKHCFSIFRFIINDMLETLPLIYLILRSALPIVF